LSLIFFALGLMSKAMVVTLPFLLLLLDIWPLQRIRNSEFGIRNWRRLLVEKIPFFALTAVFCAVTFLVQHNSGATPSMQELGLGLRLENVIVSYLRYLEWTVWPAKLAMFYAFPYDQHFYLALWPGWQIAAGVLLLAGISGLCLLQLKRRPYLAVGWFWYLGMMMPVIGFVQVGSQGMADRYTYLPLIGPVISVVWLAAEAWRTGIFAKGLLTGLVTVILAASLCQTRQQLSFWKNTETLCRHTIEVTGQNPRAEYITGIGLEHEGRIAEAIVHYRNAISSQPTVKEAYNALGRLFSQQGQWTAAEYAYVLMLGNNPNDFNSHLGLVTTLPHLGRSNEVKSHLQAAVQNCPDEPEALNNLAWTLATSGTADLRDGSQAVKYAERACKLTGNLKTVVVGTLAAAYAEAGRFEDAIATAQKACDLAAKNGETNLRQRNQELLELYRQHQAYHEPANP
jgi:Flp pilus assembly protein TadD